MIYRSIVGYRTSRKRYNSSHRHMIKAAVRYAIENDDAVCVSKKYKYQYQAYY